MKRVVQNLATYTNKRANGQISKHDEVFIVEENLFACEDVIVGKGSAGAVMNGVNEGKIEIISSNDEITLTGAALNTTGGPANISNSQVNISSVADTTISSKVGGVTIQSPKTLVLSSIKGGLDLRGNSITFNGEPFTLPLYYHESKNYDEKTVVSQFKYTGGDEELNEDESSSISSNELLFHTTDPSYIGSNKLPYIRFIKAVTSLGLNEAKVVVEQYLMYGNDYIQVYDSEQAALDALVEAENYTEFEWKPGLVVKKMGGDDYSYKLLYNNDEVATVQSAAKIASHVADERKEKIYVGKDNRLSAEELAPVTSIWSSNVIFGTLGTLANLDSSKVTHATLKSVRLPQSTQAPEAYSKNPFYLRLFRYIDRRFVLVAESVNSVEPTSFDSVCSDAENFGLLAPHIFKSVNDEYYYNIPIDEVVYIICVEDLNSGITHSDAAVGAWYSNDQSVCTNWSAGPLSDSDDFTGELLMANISEYVVNGLYKNFVIQADLELDYNLKDYIDERIDERMREYTYSKTEIDEKVNP